MTKLSLSPDEYDLINNTGWIITKHRVMKKVYDFFGELLPTFVEEVSRCATLFPENIKYQNGKISRGENYQLLPYAILDYPAFFWKENILAIRTMFWWGNFFSVTLHLSGDHKKKFIDGRDDILPWLQSHGYSICCNTTEWEHHFREDNYKTTEGMDVEEYLKINDKNFFKISRPVPLTQWDNAETILLTSFRELLQLLKFSFQAGEKGLLPVSPTTGSGL